MTPRFWLVPVALLTLFGTALAIEPKPSPWTPPPGGRKPAPTAEPAPVRIIDGVRDTGQFLPDTTMLYRVADRQGTARQFVEFWFASLAEYRPSSDSLGRTEFLNSMVNKEVLGLTALNAGRELGFEDRATMREFTNRVLANVLFQRLVADSIRVTEEDVKAYWDQFTYEQRIRRIQLDDLATARRVHAELVGKRLKWADAVRRYSRANTATGGEGELGWTSRDRVDAVTANVIFPLKPGEISAPFEDADGVQIVQVVERRPRQAPAYHAIRRGLRSQLINDLQSIRGQVIQQRLRERVRMKYDSTQVEFAARQFRAASQMHRSERGATLEINDIVPEFSNADTGRVLARWDGGSLSLGHLTHVYSDISPLLRPNLNSFDAVVGQINSIVLEPYMAEYARELGLERDPIAVWQIDRKREELLVGHMFQDSIQSKVWVSRTERREYYEKNKTQFVTFPSVEYAAFARSSRVSADSLAAALRAGASARELAHRDSLSGWEASSIQRRRHDEKGAYFKLLFEELRPGQVTIEGPDRQGDFLVIQLMTYDAGRQLSFEESEAYADESLQNMKAERMLNDMIARLRKRYPIMQRPDLVMKVRLSDPTLDD